MSHSFQKRFIKILPKNFFNNFRILGDHTLKIKSPVSLQNKEAVFTEVLSHISTLYYNKKKKKYLSKKAEIDIVLIFADGQQKAAGTIFLDLAEYPNNGQKSNFFIF